MRDLKFWIRLERYYLHNFLFIYTMQLLISGTIHWNARNLLSNCTRFCTCLLTCRNFNIWELETDDFRNNGYSRRRGESKIESSNYMVSLFKGSNGSCGKQIWSSGDEASRRVRCTKLRSKVENPVYWNKCSIEPERFRGLRERRNPINKFFVQVFEECAVLIQKSAKNHVERRRWSSESEIRDKKCKNWFKSCCCCLIPCCPTD